MRPFETVPAEASLPPKSAGPERFFDLEIDRLPPTQYAGRPPEYDKFKQMLCRGKRVIIDGYYLKSGRYMVSEMIDHPGLMKTYPVSPDELRPLDEEKKH